MAKRGLGSLKMDPEKARLIHIAGGKASHGGGRPAGSHNKKGDENV